MIEYVLLSMEGKICQYSFEINVTYKQTATFKWH